MTFWYDIKYSHKNYKTNHINTMFLLSKYCYIIIKLWSHTEYDIIRFNKDI